MDLATGYKLSVKGKIIATEVYVKNFADWPDYVFDKSHEKIELNELSTYLNENCYLPGLPSEGDILEKESYGVGEMQKKHLEKTEELYLYIVELNKKIEELRIENNEIKAEQKKLKK